MHTCTHGNAEIYLFKFLYEACFDITINRQAIFWELSPRALPNIVVDLHGDVKFFCYERLHNSRVTQIVGLLIQSIILNTKY